ncbi:MULTISPECIES: hypothetical protein [unclassified Nitrospina]|uniref:hypothetical protein n=1 Tax=unclassified Nitrospina TaxID=2638683 RepID=UPI003F9824C6
MISSQVMVVKNQSMENGFPFHSVSCLFNVAIRVPNRRETLIFWKGIGFRRARGMLILRINWRGEESVKNGNKNGHRSYDFLPNVQKIRPIAAAPGF